MNLEKQEKKFIEGWEHFCKCINFGVSALDADAIKYMNEFEIKLEALLEAKGESTTNVMGCPIIEDEDN